MDDSVFSSQFQAMRDAFAQNGILIDIAYTPNGRVDYLYQAGRLLARAGVVPTVVDALRGALPVGGKEPGPAPHTDLVVLDIENLDDGFLTVPEALDQLDERVGNRRAVEKDGFPLVTPVHVLHLSQLEGSPDTVRTCPATEPEVPCCCGPDEPCPPCPPVAPDGGAGVLIGICDSGLLADISSAPWLGTVADADVTGDTDPLGPPLPPLASGLHDIPRYCGHGTFVAGVARSQAPAATVHVARDFVMAGGQLEWVIVAQLQALAQGSLTQGNRPQVVNLSAGSYARRDWPLLSFSAFRNDGIVLTAAAGNDATHRRFWPAAFPWAVGVGALGGDRRHRAWFSNYGDWVNVFVPGEGLINAFAAGEYTYKEPPKRPARQVFEGRARWSGTSFTAPMVAGMIAARMTSTGLPADAATQALLDQAAAQALPHVGPVLNPWQP